jgi:hypothetical protein
MPQTTVLVQVFGDSQVAPRVEEDVHLPVWGATDGGGDGLPTGIILDESIVLCAVPVQGLVVCLRIAAGFTPCDVGECFDGEAVFGDERFPLWATLRLVCRNPFREGWLGGARRLSEASRNACEGRKVLGWGVVGGLGVGDACAEGE